MKIVSIIVAHQPAGTLVTVAAQFEPTEALEESDVARLFDLTREAAGDDTGSREPKLPTVEQASALDAPEPKTRRGRHANPLTPEVAEPAPESPTEPVQPTEQGNSRRRRPGAAAATEPSNSAASTAGQYAPATEGVAETASVNPRRRRQTSEPVAEAATSAATSPTSEPSAAGRRVRRVTETASSTAETAASPSEITDADLSKAASQAAGILTPKTVKELIAGFGVEAVGKIKPEDRRRFLDKVKSLVEAAS